MNEMMPVREPRSDEALSGEQAVEIAGGQLFVLLRRAIVGLWLAVALATAAVGWSGSSAGQPLAKAWFAFTLLIAAIAWAAVVLMAWCIRPPQPVSESRALLKRLWQTARIVLAVFVFFAGSAWGSFLGVVFNAAPASAWDADLFAVLGGFVWPIVGVIAGVVAWVMVLMSGLDVARTPDEAKRVAISAWLERRDARLPDSIPGQVVLQFVLWMCRGRRTTVGVSVLGPLVILFAALVLFNLA
ncbi:MAG: hypothetical protein LBV06_00545 [Propionibacteriaceae bacterium]|jgi:hypothetical protein|nr:hypothetical protein [Propionibacteriaceae bacterium]